MKNTQFKLFRKVAVLLTLIMLLEQLLPVCSALKVYAAQNQSESYVLEHNVLGAWDGGCTAQIVLRNVSDEKALGWTVTFDSKDEITCMWGAKITDSQKVTDASGSYYKYTVVPESYTAQIEPYNQITFGYNSNGSEHAIWNKSAELVYSGKNKTSIQRHTVYEGDGYKVECDVPDSWDGAYNARFIITNTGNETIHNWAILMDTSDAVTNLYNAVELSDINGTHLIKNAGHNQDIPVGGSINFGYTACYEESADVPNKFKLANYQKKVEKTECAVSLYVTEEWDDGGLAQIVLENTSGKAIEDWMLEFDSNLDIAEIWDGVIENHVGNHYTIRNEHYAQNIPAGETATTGILFKGAACDIENIEVRKVVVDEKINDDSSIVNFDTSSAPKNVGRIFYKELVYQNDIGTTPEGIACVKDQLIIYVKGVDYDKVEAYVKEDGARIVGCIESIGCYQIEYNKSLTTEQLGLKRETYEAKDWVVMAGYNLVQVETPTTDYYHSSDPYGASIVRDWNTDYPRDEDWGIEEIDLTGALIKAKVIDDVYDTTSTTAHLSKTKIGIIDNAFDDWHKDLNGSFAMVWQNYTQTELDAAYQKNVVWYHGSHIAGIIGAEFDNKEGITGVGVKSALYGFAESFKRDKYNLWFDDYYNRPDDENALIVGNDVSCVMQLQSALALLITVNEVKAVNYSSGYPEAAFAMCFNSATDDAIERKEHAKTFLDQQASHVAYELDHFLDDGYDFLIVSSAGNVNNQVFYMCKAEGNGYLGFVLKETYEANPSYYELLTYMKKTTFGGPNAQNCRNKLSVSVDAKYMNAFNYISDSHECYKHIICVGAMDGRKRMYNGTDFSCTGSRVDILAPGVDIYSCSVKDTYAKADGTSQAAPFVTGAISLAYSVASSLKAEDLKDMIISSARDRGLDKNVLNVSELISEVNLSQSKNKGNMGRLRIHVTDQSGKAVPNADVRICTTSTAARYTLAFILLYDAVDYSKEYKELKTDSNGDIDCNLPAGYYTVLINDKDSNSQGRIASVGWFQANRGIYHDGLEAGKTYSMTVALEPYADDSSPSRITFQVKNRNNENLDYSTITLYKGWGTTAGSEVAKATGGDGYRVWGWVGLSAPQGCYTAKIEKEGYETKYVDVQIAAGQKDYLIILDDK